MVLRRTTTPLKEPVRTCSRFFNPSLTLSSQQICFDGECRDASFLRADECNAKCHGHGVSVCECI